MDEINYEELTDREKEIWDHAYELGHDKGFDDGQDFGWDEGYESALEGGNDQYDDGYYNGKIAGIEQERQRVQDVLNMMFEAAINMGQGNKAVQYRQMMELLTPVEITVGEDDD